MPGPVAVDFGRTENNAKHFIELAMPLAACGVNWSGLQHRRQLHLWPLPSGTQRDAKGGQNRSLLKSIFCLSSSFAVVNISIEFDGSVNRFWFESHCIDIELVYFFFLLEIFRHFYWSHWLWVIWALDLFGYWRSDIFVGAGTSFIYILDMLNKNTKLAKKMRQMFVP